METCVFGGCGRRRYLRKWCRSHYQQYLDGKELTPIRAQRPNWAPAERDSEGRKLCTRCELWLPEKLFSKRKTSSDKLATYCKACHSAYARESRYNLTAEDLMAMIHQQGGTCRLCPARLADGYCVDHNHECCPGTKTCGECVRGLLCQECNKLIGKLESDRERLTKMLAYLKESHG